MATNPSTATLSGTVTWSDGTLFDGWCRLALVLPENSDGQWPTSVTAGQLSPQRLPVWVEVPILQGVFDQNTKILYNTSVEPVGSRYVAYWYDRNNRRIFPATGNPPTPFSISTNPYVISLPTLTAPSNSASYPTPSDSATRGV